MIVGATSTPDVDHLRSGELEYPLAPLPSFDGRVLFRDSIEKALLTYDDRDDLCRRWIIAISF